MGQIHLIQNHNLLPERISIDTENARESTAIINKCCNLNSKLPTVNNFKFLVIYDSENLSLFTLCEKLWCKSSC